jgi:type IV pilus assembly protein PilC
MVGIGILMFFFVLPQIGKVFLTLNLPLPGITTWLFKTSIAVSKFMIPIFGVSGVMVVLFIISLRQQWMKNIIFILIRPIPLIRNLIKKIDMARFNRIFSTLIRSAVPITDALEIALETLSWYEFREKAKVMPDEIRRGKSLAVVIKDQKVFPSIMVQMVAAGEKTASLDATLADLASFYEGEVEEEVKGLTQIIEPVLMLLVGITVGAMILSIIAPIYSVVGNFQQAAGGSR